MADEEKAKTRLEIGHVLFIDLVGYSKLLIEEQQECLRQLTAIVLATPQVAASTDEQLVRLPTGDGMALVFRESSEEPAQCAIEIAQALQAHPEVLVRMGINSGPVSEVTDLNGRTNIAGAGINMAQRVMDCGDAGHILVSQRVADDLGQFRQWQSYLHPLGECEVKHGVIVSVANLHRDTVGNPRQPAKFAAAPANKGRGWSHKYAFVIALSALLIGVVVYSLGHKATSSPPSSAARASESPVVIPDKSVAVLPFENLSSDKENSYFADGVQDEILTNLAKIADLKVISRTSVMQYRTGATRNLREIGKQLGVAHLLEGSVQRASNKVRVNAQLINATTDAHEWAEHYDRPLDDVFAIQSEIAKAIAEQLQAKIAPPQLAEIERKPTDNLQAYDAYLRGLALRQRDLAVNNPGEVSYFREAVRLDPSFADAWAWLGRELLIAYTFDDSRPSATLTEARAAVRKAYELQPGSAEANLAQGYLAYNGEGNYDVATDWFEKARKLAPGDPQVYQALGAISRRQGKWKESAAYYRQALDLSPRDSLLLAMQSVTLDGLRDYPAVIRICDAQLNLLPDSKDILADKIAAYQNMGDLRGAAALLPSKIKEDDYWLFNVGITQRIYERRYAEALVAVKTALQNPFPRDHFYWRADLLRDLACLDLFSGDHAAAQATARQFCEEILANYKEPILTDEGWLLAVAYAMAGDKAKAIAAAEPLRTSKDAFVSADYPTAMAWIGALTGDKELALPQLAIAATLPRSGISYGELLFNPLWDSLREDPRFQKIVESLKPKETASAAK